MKFQRLTIITIAILVISVLTIGFVVAQEPLEVEEIGVGETQEIIDPDLKPSLAVSEKQQHPSKLITIILTIDSQIDSDRVSVDWNFPSGFFVIDGPFRDVISVREGEVTEFRKDFTPREGLLSNGLEKKIEFGAKVGAFVAEENYLSATSVLVDFNSDFELLPIDPDYRRAKIISFALNWLVVILVVTAIVAAIVVAVRRFIKYVRTPDPET